MPIYEYTALDIKGRTVSGIIDAESIRSARQKLRRNGIYPTSVIEDKASKESLEIDYRHYNISLSKRIKAQDIALMIRQIATLISAGLPVVDGLTALIEQTENNHLKKILTKVRERVNEGMSLADAMKEHPKVFNNLFINMTYVGETSGALGIVLCSMADFAEKQVSLKNRLISIMAYPAIMFMAGAFVLFFLIGYIIPKVTEIFSGINQSLPLPTIILINISSIINDWWWIILLSILCIYICIKRYIKTEKGRIIIDSLLLKTPLFGELIKKLAIARFTRTLGMLIKSGLPLTNSLHIVKPVVNNSIIATAIENAKSEIESGEGIASTLRKSRIFPPIIIHMIAIGEKSGNLEDMLFKASDAYESEVQTTIHMLTSILEPVMILVMGVVVGFIVVSILLPIFEMNQLIK